MIENEIRLNRIKFDIIRNYIRVVDVTGHLFDKPFRNYLSVKQEAVGK